MPADLPPNPPERRAIEIVPLDDPVGTSRAVPAPLALPPAPPAPAPRAFPHLVVEPVPAWPAPAIRSSRHPAVALAELPEAVRRLLVVDDPIRDELAHPVGNPTIDLTAFAEPDPVPTIDLTVLDLRDAVEVAAEVAPEAAAPPPPAAPVVDATRLRALLARERDALGAPAPAGPAADAAPFPLPPVTRRRTPKPVRDDAAPRPVSGALAAAMARATAPRDAAPPAGRARDRLELVPLADPLPVLAAPATIDLRDERPAAPHAHPCPACATPGVVDVIDQIRGEIHVICPQCFRMWRTPVAGRAAQDAR